MTELIVRTHNTQLPPQQAHSSPRPPQWIKVRDKNRPKTYSGRRLFGPRDDDLLICDLFRHHPDLSICRSVGSPSCRSARIEYYTHVDHCTGACTVITLKKKKRTRSVQNGFSKTRKVLPSTGSPRHFLTAAGTCGSHRTPTSRMTAQHRPAKRTMTAQHRPAKRTITQMYSA